MAKDICKCCGQTIKAVETAVQLDVDTSTLNNEQLHAYYKKTAPVEDAKFLLRSSSILAGDLRAQLESLIAKPPARAEFYRRYRAVQDAWRALSNARERAAHEPAIGSPEWRESILNADVVEVRPRNGFQSIRH